MSDSGLQYYLDCRPSIWSSLVILFFIFYSVIPKTTRFARLFKRRCPSSLYIRIHQDHPRTVKRHPHTAVPS